MFDLDSVQLLLTVRELNQGRDMSGNALEGATDFFAGAVVTPGADPLEPQLLKFRKKLAAGAQFFQTQAIFDIDQLKQLSRSLPAEWRNRPGWHRAPGFPKMAQFLNENIPGVSVPERLIRRLAEAPKEKRLEQGMQIAAELIRTIRDQQLCQGVHIMALGREDRVPEILRMAE